MHFVYEELEHNRSHPHKRFLSPSLSLSQPPYTRSLAHKMCTYFSSDHKRLLHPHSVSVSVSVPAFSISPKKSAWLRATLKLFERHLCKFFFVPECIFFFSHLRSLVRSLIAFYFFSSVVRLLILHGNENAKRRKKNWIAAVVISNVYDVVGGEFFAFDKQKKIRRLKITNAHTYPERKGRREGDARTHGNCYELHANLSNVWKITRQIIFTNANANANANAWRNHFQHFCLVV